MKPSLQSRLVRYLRQQDGWINGGQLERLAEGVGYKASNASRRLRILEEASRGKDTTKEHKRAVKLLQGGTIERKEMRGDGRVASVWYRFTAQLDPVAWFDSLEDMPQHA